MIIAIDGPSGAGKSTLGKRLAKTLGLLYLDTGAMYRAAALAVVESNISLNNVEANAEAVGQIAANSNITLSGEPDTLRVMLDERDVTAAIRTPEVGQMASIISTVTVVRRVLVERQRELGRAAQPGCVLDGRDIGTVVFPDAAIKFFLTADPLSRARRRYDEQGAANTNTTLEATLADLRERDERDTTRADSPLVIAEDAIVIDSTEFSVDEVLRQMLAAVRQKEQTQVIKVRSN